MIDYKRQHMSDNKNENYSNQNHDCFLQLMIHKISPINPKYNIDSQKFQVVTDFMDISQNIRQYHPIKNDLFTDVNETLTFGYSKRFLIGHHHTGLNLYLKNCNVDSEISVFAYHQLNINNVVYNDSNNINTKWLPLQCVDRKDQIAAFICISANILKKDYVMDVPIFNNVLDDQIEDLGLRNSDIPGNIKLEHNCIRLNLQELEFIDASISNLKIECKYGNVISRTQKIDPNSFSNQRFDIVTTVPAVNEYVTFTLYNEDKPVAVFKKSIFEFIISTKIRLLSINLLNFDMNALAARFIGNYEVIEEFSKNYESPPGIKGRKTIKIVEKKFFKLALDCVSVGNLDFIEGQMAKITLKWGKAERSTPLTKVQYGKLIINRRISLDPEFSFVDENYDALPHPELYIVNENDKILYWKILHVNDAHIFYDQNSDTKIPFKSYLMNTNNDDYAAFVHLKFFIYDSDKQLVLKRLSAKPDTTRDPCYFLIDFFSLSTKKTPPGDITAKLMIKHNDITKIIDVHKYSTFNWLNKKVALSSYRLDYLISPLYIDLQVNDSPSKALVIDYNRNLDGRPQRYKFDDDSEINISIKLFPDEESFKNSIILNQTLYKTLESPYDMFLNNQTPIWFILPDVLNYKININIWKLENFSSEVNRLRIKSPCLSIMTAPFLTLDESTRSMQQYFHANKHIIPQNPPLQFNLNTFNEILFGQQLEIEYKLPKDSRLLPKFIIHFIEKDANNVDPTFIRQSESSSDIILGSSEFDLFQLLIESKIILFKRLNKLYESLSKLDISNKNIIKQLIKAKLTELESDLNLNTKYKPQIIRPQQDDTLAIVHRAINNYVKMIEIPLNKPLLSEIKSTNCFYAIKSKIMESFNNTSEETDMKLNMYCVKTTEELDTTASSKNIPGMGRNSLRPPNSNAFGDEISNKLRSLSKYVLNETTMRDPALFVLQPQFMQFEGSKIEINIPNPDLYYKIGHESEPGYHYRFILPCSLESSIYLEDYSSWKSYQLKSIRDIKMADIRSKINVIDERDEAFFDKLDENGIDTKLINLRSGEMFSAYAPNEKFKFSLYLLDLLLFDEINNDELILEIKFDDKLVKRMAMSDTVINNDGIIQLFELIEFAMYMNDANFIYINIVQMSNEFMKEVIIASTFMDIGQRYFSSAWHRLASKPIETRNLFSSKKNELMGECRAWLDIHNQFDNYETSSYTLKQPNFNDLELRFVIWNLNDYTSKGDEQERQEIYIQGEFVSSVPSANSIHKIQQTDARFIHKNQQSVDFNHRMIWRYKGGRGSQNLKMNVRNSTTGLNYETYIDLRELSREVIQTQKIVSKAQDNKGRPKDFTVEAYLFTNQYSPLEPSKFENLSRSCHIKVRLEIFPIKLADSQPVGIARNQPNVDPYLPEPLKGNYPISENIGYVYNEIPKNIKTDLAIYLAVFLLGFVILLLAMQQIVKSFIY